MYASFSMTHQLFDTFPLIFNYKRVLVLWTFRYWKFWSVAGSGNQRPV